MEESVKELVRYRFLMGTEALTDARIMLENHRYKTSLNRSYYAIFHAIRAVNAMDGFDSSKHSGVIAHFNQHYVKEGVFTKKLSKAIKEAYENRENADYLDFFAVSETEAQKQLCAAEIFVDEIKRYLEQRLLLKE